MRATKVPARSKPVRLALVDDHELARDSLRDMLIDEPDFEIVGEAADGQEALELCHRTSPDLVFMDLRMPRLDGLAATRMIKKEHPGISVLVLTMHENPDYLLKALQAGAAGYILKDAAQEDVISAVQKVLSGESPLAPDLAAQLLRRLASEVQEREKELDKPDRAAELPQP